MSFVDELNYAIEHADQINDEAKIKQIEELANDFIAYIKVQCRNDINSRTLNGYIHHRRDIDYAFSIFKLSEKLPECNPRQMTKDANRSQYTLVTKPGISKSRVYESVLCFSTQNQGNLFVQQIENELQSLGFKHYSVILEKVRDLYLICDARKGFFHDSYKYSLEEDGYTYVVYLNISW